MSIDQSQTEASSSTVGEKLLTFVGGLLLVLGVAGVLGAIASGPGRDAGWSNFATTSISAAVGVAIGTVGGLVLRAVGNRRAARATA